MGHPNDIPMSARAAFSCFIWRGMCRHIHTAESATLHWSAAPPLFKNFRAKRICLAPTRESFHGNLAIGPGPWALPPHIAYSRSVAAPLNLLPHANPVQGIGPSHSPPCLGTSLWAVYTAPCLVHPVINLGKHPPSWLGHCRAPAVGHTCAGQRTFVACPLLTRSPHAQYRKPCSVAHPGGKRCLMPPLRWPWRRL